MNSIFSIINSDLTNQSPQGAVDVFRELIWAEARAIGVATSLIDVPSAITVADGGIDAEIRNVQITGGQGIIKLGLTCYQIKAGAFTPNESSIKEVLFVERKTELYNVLKNLDSD